MSRATVQSGSSTWAGSVKPAKPHGDEKTLRVAGSTERAFIHVAEGANRGSTVVSAVLTIYAKGASTGSRTITLRRITDTWKARTLDWNHQPAVTDVGMVSVTVGALADKDPIAFNVAALLQPMVSGTTQNFGWRISTTGSEHAFYSARSGVKNPTLVVDYVEGPGAPTKQLPAGGLVGVAQPTLQFAYTGAEDMAGYQVQADPDADEVTPAYDTGPVSATDPIHALAGTTFNQLPTSGSVTSWRARVTDTAGITSEWSDWVDITRDDKGTLTLNNPAVSPNNFVTEPTPPFLFSLAGETLAAYRLLVTDAADHNKIIHNAGLVASTVGAYTMPLDEKTKKPLLLSGHLYALNVQALDAKQRQGSLAAGDEPYVEVWRDFTVNDSASVTAPVLSSVAQSGATPAAALTFTRATAPDGFVILRDGVEIDADVLPGDVFSAGTTYVYLDWSAHPRTAHAYTVKAVVNGVQSLPSASVTVAGGGTAIEGLWVCDWDTGRYFVVSGTGVSDWKQTEVGTTYWPLGARSGFRVTQALGGLTGTFGGFMRERTFRTVLAMETDLWAMKEDAPHAPRFRLVGDTMNIPVQITDLSCAVSEESVTGYPRRQVTFGFWQTGEFEFEGLV